MKGSIEILDHPADIGIKVKGKSLQELFTNAALGTTSLIIDAKTISQNVIKEISLNGNNIEELFIKWLDEIVYLFDAEGFIVKNIKVETSHEMSLRAIIMGEKFNPDKHQVKLYLKAVTYHQLEIKQIKEGWEAIVFFDV